MIVKTDCEADGSFAALQYTHQTETLLFNIYTFNPKHQPQLAEKVFPLSFSGRAEWSAFKEITSYEAVSSIVAWQTIRVKTDYHYKVLQIAPWLPCPQCSGWLGVLFSGNWIVCFQSWGQSTPEPAATPGCVPPTQYNYYSLCTDQGHNIINTQVICSLNSTLNKSEILPDYRPLLSSLSLPFKYFKGRFHCK